MYFSVIGCSGPMLRCPVAVGEVFNGEWLQCLGVAAWVSLRADGRFHGSASVRGTGCARSGMVKRQGQAAIG
jgi:hypothetical protein